MESERSERNKRNEQNEGNRRIKRNEQVWRSQRRRQSEWNKTSRTSGASGVNGTSGIRGVSGQPVIGHSFIAFLRKNYVISLGIWWQITAILRQAKGCPCMNIFETLAGADPWPLPKITLQFRYNDRSPLMCHSCNVCRSRSEVISKYCRPPRGRPFLLFSSYNVSR